MILVFDVDDEVFFVFGDMFVCIVIWFVECGIVVFGFCLVFV